MFENFLKKSQENGQLAENDKQKEDQAKQTKKQNKNKKHQERRSIGKGKQM